MKRKKRFFLLFLSIIFLGIGMYTIFHFPPTYSFSVHGIPLPLFPFVAFSFGLFLLLFLTLVTKSLLNGFLLCMFAFVYLILRFFGLTSIFFLIVILAIVGTIELFFINKR